MIEVQAVVFGAGNVGRGFLGQLFSESGYEVVFVDVDQPLIDALNARGGYTIRLVDNDGAEEVGVSPVRALHAGQAEAVAQALVEGSLAATAVGVRALPQIAPLVAAGVARRDAAGVPDPLNIIVCENLVDGAATFRRLVREHLPAAHRPYLEAQVGFVDTVIARMVPPPSPALRAQDPSLIVVEPYKELPVDRSGFVGPVPKIAGLEACDNFRLYTARKLYLHNCGHAILAYLGHLRGHVFGFEALDDAAIRPLYDQALVEASAGIMAAFGVEPGWLQPHIADLTRRFANRALADTTFRLARDPLRKLGPQDRLVGAARLAEQAGQSPQALSWGIAAAYCFDAVRDPLALSLQQRISAAGLDAVLAEVSQIRAGEPLAALVQDHYRRLWDGRWP